MNIYEAFECFFQAREIFILLFQLNPAFYENSEAHTALPMNHGSKVNYLLAIRQPNHKFSHEN